MKWFAFASLFALPALAAPPQITSATATRTGDSWRIDVTLLHPDTGWDHYADGWQVTAPDGTPLGTRELLHPHVHEQPFTRSLSRVSIPVTLEYVLIRARCSTDGWTSGPYRLALPR